MGTDAIIRAMNTENELITALLAFHWTLKQPWVRDMRRGVLILGT